MYTDIKTFQDACTALSLDYETIIPTFEFFPESDRQAMIDHAKLVIIAKAINGDWKPDWENGQWDKYYPWFVMGSPSGGGFSYHDCVDWITVSTVGSRLCFESSEKAKYAGTQFLDLYKSYFVKS
ncbi:hypothetical protein [Flavobacterium psychrophilum]|uniref:hypothetical protein n=1 Tax=Flavobacterium psychrophilum TaxID=96345 RepID=UPI000B7C28C3|nr:hypothetical protein [Flavobacterium psychrophilum]SNA72050.1 hypothetical protein FI070_170021 [Flavobacterium psychrophilum]